MTSALLTLVLVGFDRTLLDQVLVETYTVEEVGFPIPYKVYSATRVILSD